MKRLLENIRQAVRISSKTSHQVLTIQQGEGQSVCKIFRGVFVQPQLLYLLREVSSSVFLKDEGEVRKAKKKRNKNRKARRFIGGFLRWFGFYAVLNRGDGKNAREEIFCGTMLEGE